MSVQAISWVLDESTARGAERLVLLSIANHADNVGRNSWPSVETIAKEAALGLTRTKQAIRKLAEEGVLEVEPNAGGAREVRADRRPNRYTIVPLAAVDNPETDGGRGGHTSDPRQSVRGSQNGGHGGQTGDREPSLNRPTTRANRYSTPADPREGMAEARRIEHERNARALAEAAERDLVDETTGKQLARKALDDLRARKRKTA